LSRRSSVRNGLAASACVALALGCAACAPATPSSSVPLAIDVVWSQPGQPESPVYASAPNLPEHIVIRWDPNDYSRQQILDFADWQCGAFDRRAHAVAEPSTSAGPAAQRFTCMGQP